MDVSHPMFGQRAAELDPSKTYYLYCRSGSRSGHATAILRSQGIDTAFNIGGLSSLARAGVATAA
jgi:rhodanese-related sulfurtransferase